MAQHYEVPMTPMEEPPKRRNTAMIVGIVIVILLLCCCAVAAIFYFWLGDLILNLLEDQGIFFTLFQSTALLI